MKDLKAAFKNPPKDGRLTDDLKTTAPNDMTRAIPTAPTGMYRSMDRAGVSSRDRAMLDRGLSPYGDMQSVIAASPAYRNEEASRGPIVGTSARDSFDSGVDSARAGIRRSADAGQPDVRNHEREYPTDDNIGDYNVAHSYHEIECGKAGYGRLDSKRDYKIPDGRRSDGKLE